MKDNLVKDLVDTKYYVLLTDASTDSGVLEQELIYAIFLNKCGHAEVRFYIIEIPDNANAERFKGAVELALNRVGITEFIRSLFGLNVDGTSGNKGIHGGLEALLREFSLWLTIVYSFNYRLELAARDAFKGTFFDEVAENYVNEVFQSLSKRPKATA